MKSTPDSTIRHQQNLKIRSVLQDVCQKINHDHRRMPEDLRTKMIDFTRAVQDAQFIGSSKKEVPKKTAKIVSLFDSGPVPADAPDDDNSKEKSIGQDRKVISLNGQKSAGSDPEQAARDLVGQTISNLIKLLIVVYDISRRGSDESCAHKEIYAGVNTIIEDCLKQIKAIRNGETAKPERPGGQSKDSSPSAAPTRGGPTVISLTSRLQREREPS